MNKFNLADAYAVRRQSKAKTEQPTMEAEPMELEPLEAAPEELTEQPQPEEPLINSIIRKMRKENF